MGQRIVCEHGRAWWLLYSCNNLIAGKLQIIRLGLQEVMDQRGERGREGRVDLLLVGEATAELGIVLELGLGATAAHRDHGTVLKVKRHHVRRARQARLLVRLARVVADLEITHARDGKLATRRGVVALADRLEDRLHGAELVAEKVAILGSKVAIPNAPHSNSELARARPRTSDAMNVLGIERLEVLLQRLALCVE